MIITKDGAFYRQFLPHYRAPGSIYHCRFSLDPAEGAFRLTQSWMYAEVESSIWVEHKKECIIHAYIVMDDHAHLAIEPLPKANTPLSWWDYRQYYPLERITGRIKGRSSFFINKRLDRSGSLWQGESFDRIIRDTQDIEEVIFYIHDNPVRRRIVASPEEYRWSSLWTIYSGQEQYRDWFDLPCAKEPK